jgi:hypothetical protein
LQNISNLMFKSTIKAVCTFIFIFLLLLVFKSKASHVAGGEITYKCIGNSTYEITMKVYRDCQGIPLCNCPGLSGCTLPGGLNITAVDSTYNGINLGNVVMTVVPNASSGYDVIELCHSTTSVCSNCGTRSPGTFSPGIEMYTFTGIAYLSNLNFGICNVNLGFSTCCRNTANTTLQNPGGIGHFIDCNINACYATCNSSPIFNNSPVIAVCAGQDVIYNLSTSDPDGDSLSYSLGSSLTAANTPAPYKVPYSASYPFPFFGAPNINAPLPMGIHIDAVSGDISFKPIGNFVSNFVIEVKQWRYLPNGTPYIIGTNKRDIQFYSVSTCSQNNTPKFITYNDSLQLLNDTGIISPTPSSISSNYKPRTSFSINTNSEFCFRLIALDDAASTDTTEIKLNIPDILKDSTKGSYTISKLYNVNTRSINRPKYDSIRFCWTPYNSAASRKPYYITFTAKDVMCPIPAKITKSFSILVNNPGITLVNKGAINNKYCTRSNYVVSYSNNNFSFNSGNIFSGQLSDSAGLFNNPTTIGQLNSSLGSGTINVYVPNITKFSNNYRMRVVSTNPVSISLDSQINISLRPEVTFISNAQWQCKGNSFTFKVDTSTNNNQPNFAQYFNWYRYANNQFNFVKQGGSYTTVTKDSLKVILNNAGCKDSASTSIDIITVGNTNANRFGTIFKCKEDSISLFPLINDSNNLYQWVYKQGNNLTRFALGTSNISAKDSGIYYLAASNKNNACIDSSANIFFVGDSFIKSTITASKVQNLCANDTMTLTSSSNTAYQWHKDNILLSNSKSVIINKSGNYRLIGGTGVCADTAYISSNYISSPLVLSNTISSFCQNVGASIKVNSTAMSSNYIWSINGNIIKNSSDTFFNTYSNGILKVVSNTNAGCKDSLSISLSYLPKSKANVSITGDSMGCQGSPLTISTSPSIANSYYFQRNGLHFDSTSNSISITQSGLYRLILLTKSSGCIDTSRIVNIALKPLPNTDVLPSDSSYFCKGHSTLLSYGQSDTAGLSFTWLNGANNIGTNSKIQVNQIGTYQLKVKGGNACIKFSKPILVKEEANPIINVSPTGTITICQGTSISLVGAGANSYQWRMNGQNISNAFNPNYNANTSGSYQLIGTNLKGCSDSSNTVQLTVNPLPLKPKILRNADTLISSTIADSYNWYLNGDSITNAHNQKYVANLQGLYRVKIINNFNCVDSSDEINFYRTGIAEEANVENIKLFPNPSNNFSILSLEEYNWSVYLTDITGKMVRSYKLFKGRELLIQKDDLKNGMYLVNIKNTETNHSTVLKLLFD